MSLKSTATTQGKAFAHTPLESSTKQIRLLSIHRQRKYDLISCTLDTYDGTNVVPYRALSYAWGPPPATMEILINGCKFMIRQNLWDFLNVAQETISEVNIYRGKSRAISRIWIDQISIDQENPDERRIQVSRMDEVYSQATQVIVWLGPEKDDSAAAMRIIDHLGSNVRFDPVKYEISPLPGSDEHLGDLVSMLAYEEREWWALTKLFARSWFKRLWVRQEVVLAEATVIVIAGSSRTTWSRFGQAAGCIECKISVGATNAPFSNRFINDIDNAVALYRTALFRHPVMLLNYTRSCECEDDRDRLYSLLGLMAPRYRIQPDYSRAATETFKELMLRIYKEDGRLDSLAFGDIQAVPSWIPHLDRPNPPSHYWRNFATGYSQAHVNVWPGNKIKIAGLKCDKVKELIGHVKMGCSDHELEASVRDIFIQHLGRNTKEWQSDVAIRLTKTLLSGHWTENTHHPHDPPIRRAVEVLKGWAEDSTTRGNDDDLMDMIVCWTLLNALPGWSVYLSTEGLFGLCPSTCLPNDEIYTIVGCKDPIIMRAKGMLEGAHQYAVVGPTYLFELSCGQALLGEHTLESSFVDSFHNPHLNFTEVDEVEGESEEHIFQPDPPYNIEDDRPLWHRENPLSSCTQTKYSRHIGMIRDRGIRVEDIVLT